MSAVAMTAGGFGVEARGRSRTRLTRRGRILVIVLAAVICSAMAFGWAGAQADAPVAAQPVVVHTVVSGETVWQIAASVTPQGGDVRDTIEQIGQLNSLTSTHIEPGQVLILPKR